MIASSGNSRDVLINLKVVSDPGNGPVFRKTGDDTKNYEKGARDEADKTAKWRQRVHFNSIKQMHQAEETAQRDRQRLQAASDREDERLHQRARKRSLERARANRDEIESAARDKAIATKNSERDLARQEAAQRRATSEMLGNVRHGVRGVSELTRAFVLLSSTGGKSTEELINKLMKLEGAMALIRGGVSFGRIGARMFPGAAAAAMEALPGIGAAVGTAAVGAAPVVGAAAAGTAALIGVFSLFSKDFRQGFSALIGTFDDGTDRLRYAFDRAVQKLDAGRDEITFFGAAGDVEERKRSAIRENRLARIDLDSERMTPADRANLRGGYGAVGATGEARRNAAMSQIGGATFADQFGNIKAEFAESEAQRQLADAVAGRGFGQRQRAIDGKLAEWQSAKADAHQRLEKVNSILHEPMVSGEVDTDDYRDWKKTRERQFRERMDFRGLQDDTEAKRRQAYFKESKQSPTNQLVQFPDRWNERDRATQAEVKANEEILKLRQEQKQLMDNMSAKSMETNKEQIASLEKQFDAVTKLAISEKQRLTSGKEAFAQMGAGPQTRMLRDFEKFEAGGSLGKGRAALKHLIPLVQAGLVDKDDPRYRHAIDEAIPKHAREVYDRLEHDTVGRAMQEAAKISADIKAKVEQQVHIVLDAETTAQSLAEQLKPALDDLMHSTLDVLKNELDKLEGEFAEKRLRENAKQASRIENIEQQADEN